MITSIDIYDFIPRYEEGTIISLFIVSILLAIVATVVVFRRLNGIHVPVWCILIWTVSFVGPILALIYVISRGNSVFDSEQTEIEKFLSEEPHRKYLSNQEIRELFDRWKQQNSKE